MNRHLAVEKSSDAVAAREASVHASAAEDGLGHLDDAVLVGDDGAVSLDVADDRLDDLDGPAIAREDAARARRAGRCLTCDDRLPERDHGPVGGREDAFDTLDERGVHHKGRAAEPCREVPSPRAVGSKRRRGDLAARDRRRRRLDEDAGSDGAVDEHVFDRDARTGDGFDSIGVAAQREPLQEDSVASGDANPGGRGRRRRWSGDHDLRCTSSDDLQLLRDRDVLDVLPGEDGDDGLRGSGRHGSGDAAKMRGVELRVGEAGVDEDRRRGRERRVAIADRRARGRRREDALARRARARIAGSVVGASPTARIAREACGTCSGPTDRRTCRATEERRRPRGACILRNDLHADDALRIARESVGAREARGVCGRRGRRRCVR